RGGGQAPPGGGRCGHAGQAPRRAAPGPTTRRSLLLLVVSIALAGLGLLAEVRPVRALGAAPPLRGAGGAAAGARRVPRHGAVRAEARIPSGGAVSPRGCRSGTLR